MQPKLNFGSPNDKYEQEADAKADKVMSMPAPKASDFGIQRKCAACEQEEAQTKPLANLITPLVQRMSPEEEELQTKAIQRKGEGGEARSSLESRLNARKGSGNTLPAETQEFMGSRFGTDFGGVKVHTNSSAVQMNKELNSQAFAHGNDIYFNQGKYDTSGSSGKQLLAHELTHTEQQGAPNSIRKKGSSKKKPNKERRKKLYYNDKKKVRDNSFEIAKKKGLDPKRGMEGKKYYLEFSRYSKDDLQWIVDLYKKFLDIDLKYLKGFGTYYLEIHPSKTYFDSSKRFKNKGPYILIKTYKSQKKAKKGKKVLEKKYQLKALIVGSPKRKRLANVNSDLLNIKPIYGLYLQEIGTVKAISMGKKLRKAKPSFTKHLYKVRIGNGEVEGKRFIYPLVEEVFPKEKKNMKLMRNIIRHYDLVTEMCEKYGFDKKAVPYILAMIFKESGKDFFEDEKLTIRFEVNQFHKRWVNRGPKAGKSKREATFGKNFKKDVEEFWYKKDRVSIHRSQTHERAALQLAIQIGKNDDFKSESAAYESISMGVGQVMGFNTPNAKKTFNNLDQSRRGHIDPKADRNEVVLMFTGRLNGFSRKWFNKGQYYEGARRYNGGGDLAKFYGRWVVSKGRSFERLIRKMKEKFNRK